METFRLGTIILLIAAPLGIFEPLVHASPGSRPADAQSREEPQQTPSAADSDPEWDEQVEVRAVAGPETPGPLGASRTVLVPGTGSRPSSSLTEVVTDAVGVSENGQGGLFQVVSIRGVSGQRVTSLISGMRISGDRRAGVSSSFLDPTLMGSVEVLRGPATTFYGSGALGGVLQVGTREFDGWTFATGYDSDGDESFQLVGVGGRSWSFGFARRDAGDGEAADGTKLNSGFTQYSAVFRGAWTRGKRRYELLAIPSLGEEIGKPNSGFPERTTDYPLERHQLVKFSMSSDRGSRLGLFLHAQDLETEVVERQVEQSNVSTDSFDYGIRWETDRDLGERIVLHAGVDSFARRGVDAREDRRDLTGSTAPVVERFRTLVGADESEVGLFGSLRLERKRTRIEIGSRLTWQEQENERDRRDDSAWSGFVGLSGTLLPRLELRGALSSGLRFPSLTELFFSGATGRGQVIGNPDLDPERSLNVEIALQWTGSKLLVHGGLFRNRIEEYIERIEIAPDVRGFANLTSGTIRGVELQAVAHPAQRLSFVWGGHVVDGEDSTGLPLADTPPDELYIGAIQRWKRLRAETRLTLRDDRDDPGSGETPIPSAELWSLSLAYEGPTGWGVVVGSENLLDEAYYPSADEKASLAPGRTFGVRISKRGL